jgi:hypothetical protein
MYLKVPQEIAAELRSYRDWSLDQIENRYHRGCLSQRTFRWYCFFWEWAAPRLSSNRQSRAWNKLGEERFLRRLQYVESVWRQVTSQPDRV